MRAIRKIHISPKMQLVLFMLLFNLISVDSNAEISDVALICPDDITIPCCRDYTNTELTGHPENSNPGYYAFDFEDELYINDCREGYIIRHWKAQNGFGESTCEQRITMEYIDDFDGMINWPDHWEGRCGDEFPYTLPLYDRGFCDQIAHTFKDDTLRMAGSVCMKILRNWKVIDWCKYVPNTASDIGLWEYTQVLKRIETIKPEFVTIEDWQVKANNADCTADFEFAKEAVDENCEVISDLAWEIELDIDNDWSVDTTAFASGAIATFTVLNLPVGEHKIFWTVSDPCGNTNQCMELIYVEDGKPPTPFCYLSFPTVLMPQTNMLEVEASQFIKDAYDNCSEKSDLIFSWTTNPEDTRKVFTCSDIGYQFLPIYNFDETGNYDFCFVFTRVRTHGDCSQNLNLVSGTVSDFSDNRLENIIINLGQDAMTLHKVDTSDHSGSFSFPYAPTIADPALYFSKAGASNSGISTLDLYYMQKFLLGLKTPNHFDQFKIAADLNSDGKINVEDMIRMKDLVLGKSTWEEFENGANGLQVFVEDEAEPGKYNAINSYKELEKEANFKIISLGDIDSYFGQGN